MWTPGPSSDAGALEWSCCIFCHSTSSLKWVGFLWEREAKGEASSFPCALLMPSVSFFATPTPLHDHKMTRASHVSIWGGHQLRVSPARAVCCFLEMACFVVLAWRMPCLGACHGRSGQCRKFHWASGRHRLELPDFHGCPTWCSCLKRLASLARMDLKIIGP